MLNQRSTKARKVSALPCKISQQIILVAEAGYPLPPWSIGIIELGKILDLIYGLQSLRGKILSRKELAAEIGFFKELCGFSFLYRYHLSNDLLFGRWKARSHVTLGCG
jgi:hypothetical protein